MKRRRRERVELTIVSEGATGQPSDDEEGRQPEADVAVEERRQRDQRSRSNAQKSPGPLKLGTAVVPSIRYIVAFVDSPVKS